MQQEITEASATAVASGLVKAAPPVAVSGALTMGVGVPELIQYLTLLWLIYQFVDALLTGLPKWRARYQAARHWWLQTKIAIKGRRHAKSKK